MSHPKIDLQVPRLEAVVGCMFSGKTEELLARLDLYKHAKANLILLRPDRDTRKNETHAGREFKGIPIPAEICINDFIKLVGQETFEQLQVVGIDEGNFFEEETFVEFCENLVEQGKIVIVAGLDMTFAQDGYGPMPRLMVLADILDKNQAVCDICQSPYATRSQRFIDGKPAAKDSPQNVVGDADDTQTEVGVVSYKAVCRKCYVKVG